MKINPIPSVCAVLIAGLAAWLFHASGFSVLVTITCGITLMLSLFVALGVELENKRRTANIKLTGWVATVLFVVVGVLAGLLKLGPVFVLISNLFIVIVAALTLNNLYHAKM